MVNEGTIDPRVGRWYTSLLGTVMVMMKRKSSLNMIGSVQGKYFFPVNGAEESIRMLKVSEMIQPGLVKRERGRTINRFHGKTEEKRKWSEEETGRRNCSKEHNARWEINKINNGWCIRVRNMNINNLLKVKRVTYNIQFSLRG